MNIEFKKYQGTGNDFIIIDNRSGALGHKEHDLYKAMCDRRFGIGADGLILFEDHDIADFRMVYFNSDGHESSMCGNGGRCIVRYAKDEGLISKNEVSFEAIDGIHHARIQDELIELQMQNVNKIEPSGEGYFLDTGSPHFVAMKNAWDDDHFIEDARRIRNGAKYKAEGVNVNFMSIEGDELKVRTYERGVEDETLSCGTGVTASALVYMRQQGNANLITIEVKGGSLKVKAKQSENAYQDIWLIGPASKSFEGLYEV